MRSENIYNGFTVGLDVRDADLKDLFFSMAAHLLNFRNAPI